MTTTRARRRELRRLMDEITEIAAETGRRLAAEGLLPGAEPTVVLEGKVINGEVVVVPPPAPLRRRSKHD
jgi:hypothetical protein